MSTLIAKDNGGSGNAKPIPAGIHLARCIRVIDLGTQYSERYQKLNHKILLVFEIPGQQVETKEKKMMPMLQSKNYTLSLGEKADLRKDLETWRGKSFTSQELQGFDIAKIVGAVCNIGIVHQAKKNGPGVSSKITAIFKAKPEETKTCTAAAHETFVYEIGDGTGGNFPKLFDWMQKEIMLSEEMKAKLTAQATGSADDGAGFHGEDDTHVHENQGWNTPGHPDYIPNEDLPF